MRAICDCEVGKPRLLVLLLILWSAFFLLGKACPAVTFEEAIDSLKGLSPEARQKKLEEGSKRESKPAFYHSVIVEDAREILAGFKSRYPFIDYAAFRLGNVRLVGKIATEAKAGRHDADVIQTSGLFGHQLIQQGLVAKYSSPETQNIPAEFVDRTGYWTAFQQIPVVLGFNTRMVNSREIPKGYEEVLDAKWRGRLVLDSDDQDVLAGLADAWGEEKAIKFFHGLSANRAALRRGRVLIGQFLAAGEFPIALFLHSQIPISLKDKGAPVGFVYLPPYTTKLTTISIAKQTQHPYSAILLYDYLLSKDLQKMMVEKLDRESIRKDVEGKYPQLKKPKYTVVNPATEGARIQQYQKLFSELFGTL